MKKIGYLSSLVAFVAFFCYEASAKLDDDPVSKALRTSRKALVYLQQQGRLTDKSVEEFKTKIQSVISNLNKQKDDDIGDRRAIQKDLIKLVEDLKNYQNNPTELKAKELREYAKSDSLMAPFIKKIMDQQKDPKFRFEMQP